jgi:cardiolipin synthase
MYHLPRHNHSAEKLLTSPSAIFSSLIADLQRARDTIDMEYYIFANDRTGRLFVDILSRKARQGLRVRLIIDGYGSFSLGRELRKALLRDGVELQCHTLLSFSRCHRKMAIIDGSIAHIGGINIADRYIMGNALGKWHDVQLRITGDAVAAIQSLFDYDYMTCQGLRCEVPMPYMRRRLQVVWSESRSRRAMHDLLHDIVSSAKQSILLTTPYYIPPRSVIECLGRAVERGVAVKLIVPERCDVWLLDDVMRRCISWTMAHNIDVHICREAFLHAKLAIVDSDRVVVGSANLDARSLYHNSEMMVVTTNREVVESAERFIEEMLAISTVPTQRDKRSYIPAFLCRCFENLL